MKKKILSGHRFHTEPFKVLEEEFDITYPSKETFNRAEVLELISDFDVFIPNFNFLTDKEIIDRGSRLKLIANFGVGYNTIDVDYASKKNIVVCNTPHSVTEPTAEICFALMGAVARNIGFLNSQLRTPEGVKWGIYDNLGLSLNKKTLGILGFGRIGQAVARRAIASGMSIIYHSRNHVSPEIETLYNAEYVSFDELIAKSDVLSINTPATPETHHIISKEAINQMKPNAILINTSRGSTVDEKALIEALRSRRIFGAGLDVFESEPHINSEFFNLENVILTPHVGTQTIETRIEMQEEVVGNISAFFNEGNPSRVN